MKKSKIICISPWFLPRYGGGETRLNRITDYLKNNQFECIILTLRFGKLRKNETLPNGVKICRFDNAKNIKTRKIAFRQIIHYIKDLKDISCIYMHLGVASDLPIEEECNIIAIAKQLNIPIVIRVTSDGRVTELVKLLPASIHDLRKVNKFVSLNKNIKSELKLYGVKETNIVSINNGTDNDMFRPISRVKKKRLRNMLKISNKITYISHSRFSSKKNIPLLIRAWSEACTKEPKLLNFAQLIIIGDDNQGTENIQTSKEINQLLKLVNPGNIILLPSKNSLEIKSYLQSSDFFINLSLQEGMSNSTIEAISTGLTCILSKTKVNKYLLGSQGGILADTSDVESISKDLIKCFNYPKKLTLKIKKYNRKRALLLFNDKLILKQYLELFRGLIK